MKSGNVISLVLSGVILLGGLLYLNDFKDGLKSDLESINQIIENNPAPASTIDYSSGQLIYVPIYSQVPFNNKQNQNLNVLLSVRNTDAKNSIVFSQIDLYDTEGNIVKQYASSPVTIGPLGTYEIFITQDDTSGGSGGNFYLQWESENEILEPYVEALLYGRGGTHTYSFNSLGKIVSRPSE